MPLPTMIPETRPISDLRTCLPELEHIAKETGEPIVLTRNGAHTLILQDSQAYNQRIQRERHIRKLREAEIEVRYREESYTLEQSQGRLEEIAQLIEAAHA